MAEKAEFFVAEKVSCWFWGILWFFVCFALIFLLRLLVLGKLRLSRVAGCVFCCFFGLGCRATFVVPIWDGRNATFHVDST